MLPCRRQPKSDAQTECRLVAGAGIIACLLAAIAPLTVWLSLLGRLIPRLLPNTAASFIALDLSCALLYPGLQTVGHKWDAVVAKGRRAERHRCRAHRLRDAARAGLAVPASRRRQHALAAGPHRRLPGTWRPGGAIHCECGGSAAVALTTPPRRVHVVFQPECLAGGVYHSGSDGASVPRTEARRGATVLSGRMTG